MERKTLSELLKQQLAKQSGKGSTAEEICDALIWQAKQGQVKAFEVIRDTIGEKPVENINAQVQAPTFIDDLKK